MKLFIRRCIWILFLVYGLVLFKFLILDRLAINNLYHGQRLYNFVPFDSIKRYIFKHEYFRLRTLAMNLLGNLIMLAPLGFILPVLFKRHRRTWYFLCIILLFNLGIEVFQYITALGSFDVDDLILNCFGAVAAYAGTRLLFMLPPIRNMLI